MPSLLDKVKFLCVAGVGLFSDGYLNLTIGLGSCISKKKKKKKKVLR